MVLSTCTFLKRLDLKITQYRNAARVYIPAWDKNGLGNPVDEETHGRTVLTWKSKLWQEKKPVPNFGLTFLLLDLILGIKMLELSLMMWAQIKGTPLDRVTIKTKQTKKKLVPKWSPFGSGPSVPWRLMRIPFNSLKPAVIRSTFQTDSSPPDHQMMKKKNRGWHSVRDAFYLVSNQFDITGFRLSRRNSWWWRAGGWWRGWGSHNSLFNCYIMTKTGGQWLP